MHITLAMSCYFALGKQCESNVLIYLQLPNQDSSFVIFGCDVHIPNAKKDAKLLSLREALATVISDWHLYQLWVSLILAIICRAEKLDYY